MIGWLLDVEAIKINKTLLLISSSGGHFEQLKMLKPLSEKYNCFFVTEKTQINDKADFYVVQTGHKDPYVLLKMMWMLFQVIYIFLHTKPDYIISTGSICSIPIAIIAKVFQKKFIYIETFAKRYEPTKSGLFIYKHNLSSLFIIQWESLKKFFPNAVYGGCIY